MKSLQNIPIEYSIKLSKKERDKLSKIETNVLYQKKKILTNNNLEKNSNKVAIR